MRLICEFFQPGHPKTKGSLTPVRTHGGRVALRDTAASCTWRTIVARCAQMAAGGLISFGPILVRPTFFLAGDPLVPGAGDVDKQLRLLLDALTDAKVYADDNQVIVVERARKVTADPTVGPGLMVQVFTLTDEEARTERATAIVELHNLLDRARRV